MSLKIQNIEIFSQIDESLEAAIRDLFSPISLEQGKVIIEYAQPVDGLYVLEKGEVSITIPGFSGVLATLGEGKSFGELSLFNVDDTASATVIVSSETAELNFCPRASLLEALSGDELLAAGFYHGSALLVAERLRTTNQKISGEIAKSMKMAGALIEEISTSGNLGFAQQELHEAGTNIISGMTDILKRLLLMKQSGEAISHEEIALLADSARDIYYSEFQVFEKVHSQLQTLGNHLDNVTRILSQQEVVEVEEDMALLDI